MNFDSLVMQLLQSGQQVEPHRYTIDNAIADATKVKLAYDSMVTLRTANRNAARSTQGTVGSGVTGRSNGPALGMIGIGSNSDNWR